MKQKDDSTAQAIVIVMLFLFSWGAMFFTDDDGGARFIWNNFFIIVSIILIIAGILSGKRLRLLENTPTSKIRSIAMGFVEIKGKSLFAKKTLKTPLLDKECAY